MNLAFLSTSKNGNFCFRIYVFLIIGKSIVNCFRIFLYSLKVLLKIVPIFEFHDILILVSNFFLRFFKENLLWWVKRCYEDNWFCIFLFVFGFLVTWHNTCKRSMYILLNSLWKTSRHIDISFDSSKNKLLLF